VRFRRTAVVSSVELMGVRLANLSEDEAVDHILTRLELGLGGWVVTPNVDILRKISLDSELARAVSRADLAIADGMPLVWASRLQRTPLKGRVAFSEMILPLAREAASRGFSFFLLGGVPEVTERAAEALRAGAPELDIVGVHCPPEGFDRDEVEVNHLVDLLLRSRPDIVVCGLGCPKQERLMDELSPRFPGMWFVGAGGTLTIVSGETAAAPSWMRRTGLEWAHRLRLEPRRLYKRYLVHDAPFALRMLALSAVRGALVGRAERSYP
jgi:N-acetylglucosaminyldiphosphoundecaprenol N-acetyl-beta-D-mannosaminyltransferase